MGVMMKLKGLKELGQGKWEYRKRIPAAVQDALGKSERKEVIEARSDRDLMRKYALVVAKIDAEIAAAKAPASKLTPRVAWEVALNEAQKLASGVYGVADPDEARELVAENLVSRGQADPLIVAALMDPKNIRLAAQAEKEAASDRAAAKLEEAQADANALTVRAEAKKADLLATAEGQTAIANSENELSAEIIAMKIRLAQLEAMPAIISEMVKPAEKIDSIKIHQVTGMGGGIGGGETSGTSTGTPVNQALDSVLGMALQMPAMQALGKELGVSLENGLGGVVNDVMDVPPAQEKAVAPDSDETTPVN